MPCVVCSVQCSACRVQYTVFSDQCAVCSVQCAVSSVQYAEYSVQYTKRDFLSDQAERGGEGGSVLIWRTLVVDKIIEK